MGDDKETKIRENHVPEDSDVRRTDSEMSSMDRRAALRRKRMEERKRQLRRMYAIIGGVFLLCVIIAVVLMTKGCGSNRSEGGSSTAGQSGQKQEGQNGQLEGGDNTDNENISDDQDDEESVPETELELTSDDIVALADRKAAMYDYDAAIELLKSMDEYDESTDLQTKAATYQTQKESCIAVDPMEVSHVFVHSLIAEPERAFDGESNQDGYNKNMVTLEEFQKIIQSMYDNGYVLVSPHHMGYIDENGIMQRTPIYLPEGKKPVIFSQDDVSYYHSYDNDGFPDKLMIDENGKVKNQYTDANGNVTIGDYDMVPVIDTFVEAHPDFSYRGMKGIVVLTGYNGVLGYHTDADYREKQHLQLDQQMWLDEHPEFDIDKDIAEATKVANAMKEAGWEFASHTWGHISVSDASLESLQTDTQKWLDNVAPIVGGTDMIIFAFGADIGDWTGYAADNPKFQYLKSVGFDYFCNVDGSKLSWVQFGETYLRTGRMNVDGYRMSVDPAILAPMFNVSEVYDYSRPPMPAW